MLQSRNNSTKTVKYTPSNELMSNDAYFFGKNSFLKSRGASLESRDGQPGIVVMP